MRVSLHSKKALVLLDYIKSLEVSPGGIRSWPGGLQYPEVTGYIIPTLMRYGEPELANRCAEYLVSIQHDDGAFPGIDGVPRSFDTAAAMEGLKYLDYHKPALLAEKWLLGMVRNDGAVRVSNENMDTHLYTMRVSWLLDNKKGARYWLKAKWESTREHYVAYALEGLWGMRRYKFVKDKLQERDWSSGDLCAEAQFAILFHKAGLEDKKHKPYVEKYYGEVSNSWTAKWILDMWAVVGD